MVEVKDITGMIEGALTQIINAKVEEEKAKAEEEKAKLSATEVLEYIFENDFNAFEYFLKLKEYVREEDKTELTDDEREEIAYEWIANNSDEALSKAIEEGADTEDVASAWISDYPEDAFDKAVDIMDSYVLKDKIKEAIDDL